MKMRKKEVVKMLKEMQKTVYNSVMFEKAGPQQKWIIENLLGSAIAELDEYPYAIGLKNKNLIESKVVHPESKYDYVDRFDDDETDYLDYDCRYSLFEPNTKESKNISAKQECMKEGIVKKIPFLLTKEMIAVCINHSNTTYAKYTTSWAGKRIFSQTIRSFCYKMCYIFRYLGFVRGNVFQEL